MAAWNKTSSLDAGGKYEEFALLGVLLDVEDGDSDYPGSAPSSTVITAIANSPAASSAPTMCPSGRSPYEMTFRKADGGIELSRRVRVGPDGNSHGGADPEDSDGSRSSPFTGADAQFIGGSARRRPSRRDSRRSGGRSNPSWNNARRPHRR